MIAVAESGVIIWKERHILGGLSGKLINSAAERN